MRTPTDWQIGGSSSKCTWYERHRRNSAPLTSSDAQFIGLMIWPCCMAMWFLYMHQQGLGFYDVLLVYNKWTDGYKGFSTDQLTHFVSVGQCILYVHFLTSLLWRS